MSLTHTVKSTMTIVGFAALAACSKSSGDTEHAEPAASQGDEASPQESANKPSDAQILGILDTVDSGEIAQAQVAITKASDARVKQFAQHMIAQHTESQEKGAVLAAKAGIMPATSDTTEQLKSKGMQLSSTLNQATEAAFDATYMRAQAQQHQEVLDMLKNRLIPAAQNAALAQQLKTTQEMVQSHLSEARKLTPLLDVANGTPTTPSIQQQTPMNAP
jgi:putative membrane protein